MIKVEQQQQEEEKEQQQTEEMPKVIWECSEVWVPMWEKRDNNNGETIVTEWAPKGTWESQEEQARKILADTDILLSPEKRAFYQTIVNSKNWNNKGLVRQWEHISKEKGEPTEHNQMDRNRKRKAEKMRETEDNEKRKRQEHMKRIKEEKKKKKEEKEKKEKERLEEEWKKQQQQQQEEEQFIEE